MKYHKGFTLVELMISVLVVGVLSKVAFPSYRSYVVKAKMAEVFYVVSADKTAVSEYFITNGVVPTTAQAANISLSTDNQYIINIEYFSSPSPYIIYTVGNFGIEDAVGEFVFESTINNDAIQWRCRLSSELNALNDRYLPGSCK